MLTNRARLTNVDEMILSFIEKNSPMSFDTLADKFEGKVDCLAKRISVFVAYGFINLDKNIISLNDKYKSIAAEISQNSMDETIYIPVKDDTQTRG
jgi:predicted transcriptional regulator